MCEIFKTNPKKLLDFQTISIGDIVQKYYTTEDKYLIYKEIKSISDVSLIGIAYPTMLDSKKIFLKILYYSSFLKDNDKIQSPDNIEFDAIITNQNIDTLIIKKKPEHELEILNLLDM